MKTPAARNPAGGDVTRPITIVPSWLQRTPAQPPAAAMPAPTSPPISACVELLGRPRYQVTTFQAIAPSSAAMMMTRPASPCRLIARILAIVLETLAWKNTTVMSAPAKLRTAESSTAWRGVRALVEIEVAIALAVS